MTRFNLASRLRPPQMAGVLSATGALQMQKNFTLAPNALAVSGVMSMTGNLQTSSAPAFSVAPAIIGTPTVGSACSCTSGTVTGSPTPTQTYQWTLNGSNISGATSATYTPVTGDIGGALRRVTTATNSVSSATSTTAPVTVVAAPTGLAFPTGFDDPIYTGMTEMGAGTLNCVAGTTYTKRSWNGTTGSWAALMANNVTANFWRMRINEGPRFRGYNNVTFNWMYIELFGDPGDHADGVQWEGGANGNNVYRNCHFRGVDGSHALIFGADGATGNFVFEDCLFTTDGTECQNALKLFADAGFGTITVSMRNCYVQQTGWTADQFLINRTVGTSACDVILWDNVRNCTWNHTTKVLTPGSLIAQPSGT